MSTEFSRLYRELCHSGPNDSVKDIYFHRERKQIFQILGYLPHEGAGGERPAYQVSKHHGKASRRRIHEAHLKAISLDGAKERKKQQEIRDLSRKTAEVNELTNQIQSLLQQNKYVGKNLWSKYDKIYGEQYSSNELPVVDGPTSKGSPLQLASHTTPEPKQTSRRTRSIIRSDYSKEKWTKEERDRLNYLYLELNRPSSHNLGAWEVYFSEFATQFRVFFPHRSHEVVVEKIKEMYATRRFTESGEGVYWANVRASSPSVKGKMKSGSFPSLVS